MFELLKSCGLIPVIQVDHAIDAIPLCRALKQGGLPVAEITFRTAAAEDAIRAVTKELPDMLVGAGTVLTCEQADKAWQAGARFLVSPGFNRDVVVHCLNKGYTILPGCATPSDIEAALALGLKAVKFFPAEALGGVAMLKALAGPYKDIHFVPTGGITAQNISGYLALPQVLACGGSWMVPQDAIQAADWARIEALARDAVQNMLGLRLMHVGLNHADVAAGNRTAQQLSALTGWPVLNDTETNCFVGSGFEIMKFQGRGTFGHIALGTYSLPRARWHLEQRGFQFDDASLVRDPAGKPRLLYLKDEIAGFGIHLLQLQEESK